MNAARRPTSGAGSHDSGAHLRLHLRLNSGVAVNSRRFEIESVRINGRRRTEATSGAQAAAGTTAARHAAFHEGAGRSSEGGNGAGNAE